MLPRMIPDFPLPSQRPVLRHSASLTVDSPPNSPEVEPGKPLGPERPGTRRLVTSPWALVPSGLPLDRRWNRRVQRPEAIDRVPSDIQGTIPPNPASEFAALAWQQTRKLADSVLTVGPPTPNQPTINLATGVTPQREFPHFRAQLREEVRAVLPSSCAPNGRTGDLSPLGHRRAFDVDIQAWRSGPLACASEEFHSAPRGQLPAALPRSTPDVGFEELAPSGEQVEGRRASLFGCPGSKDALDSCPEYP